MFRLSTAALLILTSGAAAQITDPSFETSGPAFPGGAWAQASTNFGTPLCNGDCFGAGQPTAARTGTWWAWFGGIDTATELGSLTQSVNIPAGFTNLQFYLTADSDRTDGLDFLRILIDGNVVFLITDQELAAYEADYTFVSVNIASYAGGTHTVKFESLTNGGGFLTNFFVDDLALSIGEPPTCYPNCDGSTANPFLTANDFQCFLNKYASADPYANCDGSTAIPVLTANDFQCFLNRYAAGCT